MSTITLRIAAFFFENLELLHGREIRDDGVIRNSFGNVAISWIGATDAARLAGSALVDPQRFTNACVYPTGATVASHAEIASLLSEQMGRPVRHETIPAVGWQRRLEDLATHEARVNAAMAQHISTLGAAIRADQQPNSGYLELTGETPTSVSEAITTDQLTLL